MHTAVSLSTQNFSVLAHGLPAHPAKASPFADDQGSQHRVAARGIAIAEAAVGDLEAVLLQGPWLHTRQKVFVDKLVFSSITLSTLPTLP